MQKNILQEKSYRFAIRAVKLSRYLRQNKKEYVLSKQIIKSGTAIGALVSEAEFAQSNADFINKLHIGLKEANETKYWINLIYDTDIISEKEFNSLLVDIKEIISLLVTIIKKLKSNQND